MTPYATETVHRLLNLRRLNCDVYAELSSVQFLFDGTIGSNHRCDIAIDDIALLPQSCENAGLVTTPAPGSTNTPDIDEYDGYDGYDYYDGYEELNITSFSGSGE